MPNTNRKVRKLDELLTKHFKKRAKVSDFKTSDFHRPLLEVELHSTVNLEGHCKCKLEGEPSQQMKLFFKLSPSDELSLNTMRDLALIQRFHKELHAYTVTIPTLTKFQIDNGILQETEHFAHLFPKCFGGRLSLDPEIVNFPDPNAVIVLEDLKFKNFVETDYEQGLNLKGAKVLVEKLAIFHAVPKAYCLKHGSEFLEKVLPCMNVTNTSSESYVTVPSEIQLMVDAVRETEIQEEYCARVDKAFKFSSENMCVPPENDTWIGLCHGKYFMYNVMVQRTGGEMRTVTDCKILDLQNLIRRHVLTDLAFLLTTSSSNNLLVDHLEDIIQHYHATFVQTLGKFQIDTTPYRYEVFKSEFELNFRKELLRGLQMIRFMSPRKDKKHVLRGLSPWPRLDNDKVFELVDKRMYVRKMTECMVNLLETNLIGE